MTIKRSGMARLGVMALLGAFPAVHAWAEQSTAGGLQMLSHLERGRWEIRVRGEQSVQSLCIGDQRRLIQLRHPDLSCERLVLEDNASSVTVQYICRGHGYGRTGSVGNLRNLFRLRARASLTVCPLRSVLRGAG